MSNASIISSLEITNWFYKNAEKHHLRMDEVKVQHLLFLSQVHYGLKYSKPLMPSLFVCSRFGFYESVIKQILEYGLPLMASSDFDPETESFLDLIWQKYALQSEAELNKFILSLDCWKDNYHPLEEVVVDPLNFKDEFAKSIRTDSASSNQKSKILMSQYGPVKVSSWQPRKLNNTVK